MAPESGDSFSQTDTDDTLLANFFARPIRIGIVKWNVGTPFTLQINPWTDFFTNKRVSNRIANYHNLRATLHVKFVVAGTSFHYGKIIASYHPLHVFDQFEPFLLIGRNATLTSYSQRPNIILDASGVTNGVLKLPYFHPANNLSIPIGEWQTMGLIYLQNISPLKHVSGGTTGIDIQIYAWATDVVLGAPTSQNPAGLTPQGGDEYSGSISRPAAIVQHLAGKLKDDPIIGPYAMATQTLAGNVASTASYFGYSRPVEAKQASPCTVRTMPNTTNTNISDQAIKLSLDVKQENTVDSRTIGLSGKDELTIKSIVTRPAIANLFVWPTTAATSTVIWSSWVAPGAYATANVPSVVGPPGYHMTPMCYGSLPFQYWRGSIRFRFLITASAFHRGQLIIRYDPRVHTGDEMNTNYLAVVNIEETKDFSIDVGWNSSLAYLPTLEFTSALVPTSLFNTVRQAYNPIANGVLEIAVASPLTTPSTTVNNDVTVAVYMSAGDDFEVFSPDDTNLSRMTLTPQGGEAVDSDVTGDHPTQPTHSHAFGPIKSSNELLAIHGGDPVISFRQCLKRYNLYNTWVIAANDWAIIKIYNSDFPLYKGAFALGIDSALLPPIGGGTPAPQNYNYVNMTLLNYLTPAFVARRGGLRRMYVSPKLSPASYYGTVSVSRWNRSVTYATQIRPLPPNGTTLASAAALKTEMMVNLPQGWSASTSVDGAEQNHITVELPYSNNRRFAPARRNNFIVPSEGLTSHVYTAIQRFDTNSRHAILDYVSVAEDFDLNYFLSAPVIFYNLLPNLVA